MAGYNNSRLINGQTAEIEDVTLALDSLSSRIDTLLASATVDTLAEVRTLDELTTADSEATLETALTSDYFGLRGILTPYSLGAELVEIDSSGRAASIGATFSKSHDANARLLLIETAGYVSAAWFGAKPTASGDDNSTAINAAIAAVSATGKGGTVFIPSGTYNISGTLNGATGITLSGFGFDQASTAVNGTVLNYTGSSNAISFAGDGTQANSSGFWVKNISLIGTSSADHGIYVNMPQLGGVEFCYIKGFGEAGICVQQSVGYTIRNNRIQGCSDNIRVIPTGSTESTTVWIYDNRIEDAGENYAGINIERGDMFVITRNLIESNDGHGIHISNLCNQFEISHNYFEGNGQGATAANKCSIYLQGSSGNKISHGIVTGNRINDNNSTYSVEYGIKLEYVSDCVILKNFQTNVAMTAGFSADANSNNNLTLWNKFTAAYSDSGSNVRNSPGAVNQLGDNPQLLGNLNLLGHEIRDTTVTGVMFGMQSGSPDGIVSEALGSLRLSNAALGSPFVKTTASGPAGWRAVLLTGSGWGTFADGDTTPSVSQNSTNGRTFKTGNTSATNVTDFDNGVDGQHITIIAGDANTTMKHGGASSLILKGASDKTMTTGETIRFVLDGTAWREI